MTPPPFPEVGEPAPKPAVHWPSVGQLAGSAAAGLALWGLALALAAVGVLELVREGFGALDATSLFLMASGMALAGTLTLPSAAYALARLRRASWPWLPRLSLEKLRRGIYLLPLVILLGYWISARPQLAWLLLPPLHLLAVGIPILWLVWLGRRGLEAGSSQRTWGVFAAGLTLGPAIILALELLAIVALLVLTAFFLSTRPELLRNLMDLAERARTSDLTPEELSRLLDPYLSNPRVPFTLLVYFSGLVPLIEELFKPIGVWLLAKNNLTAAEGFAAGLLSGAGFALYENLALSSQAEIWTFAVTARAGTGLLHIVTAGLSGWALALAWREGRYLRLALTYLAAVAIHGLWNSLSLLAFASALDLSLASSLKALVVPAGRIAPLGLGILTLGAFALLASFNRRLSQHPTGMPPTHVGGEV